MNACAKAVGFVAGKGQIQKLRIKKLHYTANCHNCNKTMRLDHIKRLMTVRVLFICLLQHILAIIIYIIKGVYLMQLL